MTRHKHLYDSRWRRRRLAQLRREPLCAFCARRGLTVAASVADHITPHRGDRRLFEGPLQSLCKPCHDSCKQQQERSGFHRGHGLDGAPLDPQHPWHRESAA